jgi:cell division protein FtsI (penicillin-binding protein 3)
MKPSTAAALLPMLASVFDKGVKGKDGGTAGSVMVPGFKAGGKTGTAHKYDPAIRKYSPDKYLSSFAGLAPIDAPRIAVVVVVDEPMGGDYFGGKVAGPVFGKVASETLRYLGVPGDPTAYEKSPAAPDEEPQLPSVPPPTVDEVPQLPDLSPDDSGEVIDVPDFAGMSIGRALDAARERGLEVVVRGSGRCVEQSPAAGHAAAGTVITLRFSDG